MRTKEDIIRMSREDSDIGVLAHYRPLADLIEENNCKDIIEIGTAYGGCAQFILEATGVEHFISIDPYIYYGDELGCQMPGLECQADYDLLFEHASKRLGGYEEYLLFPVTSKNIFNYLKTNPDKFDLVFIDGAHTKENVLWECEHYSQIIKSGGILCGHDWNIFEEVNEAVKEFATKNNYTINTTEIGNIWWVRIN